MLPSERTVLTEKKIKMREMDEICHLEACLDTGCPQKLSVAGHQGIHDCSEFSDSDSSSVKLDGGEEKKSN